MATRRASSRRKKDVDEEPTPRVNQVKEPIIDKEETPLAAILQQSGGLGISQLTRSSTHNGIVTLSETTVERGQVGLIVLKEHLSEIESLLASCDAMRATVVRELDRVTHDVNQLRRMAADRVNDFDPNFRVDSATMRERRHQRRWSHGSHLAFGSGKIFYSRQSRLSELLQTKDFQTIYNIFVAVLPLLFISICMQEYYQTGQAINFSLLTYSFSHLDIVMFAWIVMFLYAVLGYRWKHAHSTMPLWVMIPLYIIYQIAFSLFASWVVLKYQLGPASGMIVMCEQVRMSMKLHSFFRAYMLGPPEGRSPQTVDHSSNFSSRPSHDAGFSHFIYFIFSPTLLYRTSYPRTPYVRWTNVFMHGAECSFIILYLYVIFQKFLFPVIQAPHSEDSLKLFLSIAFNAMLPSMIVFIFGFFGLLHCWLNLWAELLQFADREFYKDWWNSTSFNEFYRKWNGVVYDFLYEYAYLDSVAFLEKCKFSKSASRALAALFVIEASAVVHEYILAVGFRFFYPMLLVMFGGPGLLFTHLHRGDKNVKGQNIFVWCMLLCGTGFLISCYSREYYERQNLVLHRGKLDAQFWREFVTPYSLQSLFESISSS
ncbi:hypothetical protein SmJEL517_g04995 [Synchytrium microbalum]|uniref:O-acyltransferase n=1 Tax=Synchytrium microbalum TaxID=1806994 RepID=A0A507BX53_9FUNG|nr:uncharacterized protein SmJEL517_g04995 [Synchytrium microbalum]TPX31718.1 hypothetical protein SmJEL517_g04995 [Synchytrium microbalum]